MELKFIHEKNPLEADHYIIGLKTSRKQHQALNSFYPSHIFTLPMHWKGPNQGFSLEQIINRQFTVPLPPPPDDPFSQTQHQSTLTTLSQEIETTVRDFMKNSEVCKYSDDKLVIVRIERTT